MVDIGIRFYNNKDPFEVSTSFLVEYEKGCLSTMVTKIAAKRKHHASFHLALNDPVGDAYRMKVAVNIMRRIIK